jgi:hypothetical protein
MVPLRVLVGFLFVVFSTLLHAAPADDLKALIEQGRSAEAYALGLKHPEELGNPLFDFYFGIAAIDSGRAGEGVLALERYVVNVPDDLNGRLELARGYFVLGVDARAREEFELVLSAKPPADIQARIERFLDAIRARESLYLPSAALVLEAGYGYDSNANGGLASTSLVLPNGVAVTVADRFVKTHDNFLHLFAGASGSRPVAPGVAVFAVGSVDGRLYDTESRLDQHNVGAAGGVTVLRERNFYRVTAAYYRLFVDNDRYRDVASVSGEWQRQLDELQAINAFVQVADLNYAGLNSARNSNFYVAGAGYRRAIIHPWQPLLRASLYLGKEDVRSTLRSDLSRDVYGARAAVSLTPAPKWGLNVGATYQRSDYDGGDPLPPGFPPLPARDDSYWAAEVSASYALTREFSVRGELLLTKNNSNNPLYEYRRNVMALKVRYEFK